MYKINNIAVLYGGSSSEREISLESGNRVHKSILELGYESYRGDTSASMKMQMESHPFSTTDVYSKTTLTNDYNDMSVDGVHQNPGVEWQFGVRY